MVFGCQAGFGNGKASAGGQVFFCWLSAIRRCLVWNFWQLYPKTSPPAPLLLREVKKGSLCSPPGRRGAGGEVSHFLKIPYGCWSLRIWQGKHSRQYFFAPFALPGYPWKTVSLKNPEPAFVPHSKIRDPHSQNSIFAKAQTHPIFNARNPGNACTFAPPRHLFAFPRFGSCPKHPPRRRERRAFCLAELGLVVGRRA